MSELLLVSEGADVCCINPDAVCESPWPGGGREGGRKALHVCSACSASVLELEQVTSEDQNEHT